jgi:hypothetical protein
MLGASLLLLGGTAIGATDLLLTFRGGIGVDPVSGIDPTSGLPTPNVVRGASVGGAPWRISRLEAGIHADGRIEVRGRGLLLAGGNGIGTNGNQRVRATLFCGPAASATSHSTAAAGVALASSGDFRIDDTLNPAPPNPCTAPVLLIRNLSGLWFAAGILANEHDDD